MIDASSSDPGRSPLRQGIAHRVEKRCVDNAAPVEPVQCTLGLPGVGNLCVQAVASAASKMGPRLATARACP